MTFILRNSLHEFIKIDFVQNISSGWCSSIHKAKLGFTHSRETARSWYCAKTTTTDKQLEHILEYFIPVYIDNIPFAKWRKLNPEYFI